MNEPLWEVPGESPMWSESAEKCVLGSMLLSDFAADQAVAAMEMKWFYAPSHRLIFNFIKDMRSRNEHVEMMTLRDRLTLVKQLDTIGGEDYLVDIAEYVPSPARCLEFAMTVRNWWIRRECAELADLARSDIEPEELTLRLEKLVSGGVSGQTARSGSIGNFAGLSRKKGVPTGFDFIDSNTTCRGLPEGQMAAVVSETGGGKTAFMGQVAYNAAKAKRRVCFATFADMEARDLADRMVKNICGWSHEPPASDPAHERWHAAVRELKEMGDRIEVYDATDLKTGRDVETFAAWFQAKHAKNPFDLVLIDYAQELTSRDTKAKTMHDQAESCAHTIRWLASRTQVPMLVGSQLTEGNEKAGTKDITKGSRVWMERAALILKIKVLTDEERQKDVKDEPYRHMQGLTVAHLMKNRFGKKNLKTWWQWVGEFARFEERG